MHWCVSYLRESDWPVPSNSKSIHKYVARAIICKPDSDLQAFHRILGALYKSQKKQESAQVDWDTNCRHRHRHRHKKTQTQTPMANNYMCRWSMRSTSCMSGRCRRRQSGIRMTGRTSFGWSALLHYNDVIIMSYQPIVNSGVTRLVCWHRGLPSWRVVDQGKRSSWHCCQPGKYFQVTFMTLTLTLILTLILTLTLRFTLIFTLTSTPNLQTLSCNINNHDLSLILTLTLILILIMLSTWQILSGIKHKWPYPCPWQHGC